MWGAVLNWAIVPEIVGPISFGLRGGTFIGLMFGWLVGYWGIRVEEGESGTVF